MRVGDDLALRARAAGLHELHLRGSECACSTFSGVFIARLLISKIFLLKKQLSDNFFAPIDNYAWMTGRGPLGATLTFSAAGLDPPGATLTFYAAGLAARGATLSRTDSETLKQARF